jgi:hypothetical protein
MVAGTKSHNRWSVTQVVADGDADQKSLRTQQTRYSPIDLPSPPTECPTMPVVQKEIRQAQKTLRRTRSARGNATDILGGTRMQRQLRKTRTPLKS